MKEGEISWNNHKHKGYCRELFASSFTAAIGCLCPNNEKADNNSMNTICKSAVRPCHFKFEKDNNANCPSPNNVEPPGDSECVYPPTY